MISLQNVVKNFGNSRAVDGISFNVSEGESVVLLGTSGCGKTTTLRMINRLTETSEGEIVVDGKNAKEVSPEQLRRNIGYVLQHNGLFPHYTIAQNIAIVPALLKWPKEKIKERIFELVEQLRLSIDILSLFPQQLSGGQQQRVGLARALAADPPILLMDEPFGALDAITRSSITKEFLRIEALKNKTIVLVTHDIREAFELGDSILLMDKGKIVQQGRAIDLLFHPKNNFVADFFSAQQMQLELNAVSLKDIWYNLPVVQGSGIENNIEIDENKSLWESMEILNLKKDTSLLVVNSDSGETRFARYDSLFEGLEALKGKSHE
ncbi:MAG TPA: ATP-binding cassette domain-containing protein [Hanamia sp.]